MVFFKAQGPTLSKNAIRIHLTAAITASVASLALTLSPHDCYGSIDETSPPEESIRPAEPTPKNGFALMGLIQGTGSYFGTGITLQTQKYWDFLAIHLSLVSNESGGSYGSGYYANSWWETTLGFRFAPRSVSPAHIRPYLSLEVSKDFASWKSTTDNGLYLRSPTLGVELKYVIHPLWRKVGLQTNMVYFEVGPGQTGFLARDEGSSGRGLLLKAGFGIVF